MIAVDTNILLRLFTIDSPHQTKKLLEFLDRSDVTSIRVSVIVLAEMGWALRRVYKMPKPAVIEIFLTLLKAKKLAIENREAVIQALDMYKASKADFADCLIAACNQAAGAAPLIPLTKTPRGIRPLSSLKVRSLSREHVDVVFRQCVGVIFGDLAEVV